jgi:hypothetical protein
VDRARCGERAGPRHRAQPVEQGQLEPPGKSRPDHAHPIPCSAATATGRRWVRRFAAEWLEREATGVSASSRQELVSALRYRRADVTDPNGVGEVLRSVGSKPIAAYLALPPGVFPPAVRSLAAAGLSDGSRIALEKPFGEDLHESALLLAIGSRGRSSTGGTLLGSVASAVALRAGTPVLIVRPRADRSHATPFSVRGL